MQLNVFFFNFLYSQIKGTVSKVNGTGSLLWNVYTQDAT